MTSSYLINNRPYETLHPLEAEYTLETNYNYIFDLSYLTLLTAKGEQAVQFLQGQLTCDVLQVNATTVAQGALCNLQGRIQALMDVVDWQGLQLVLATDLAESTQNSLAKVAMLSRVVLQQQSDYKVYGLYLGNPKHDLPINLTPENFSKISNDEVCGYSLGDNYYILLAHKDIASQLWDSFSENQRGSLAWHKLQLNRSRFEIYPDTRGLFLPHRLGLQNTSYISFNKGCYKGQEIIARTHYRAKLKHGLRKLVIESGLSFAAGSKLFAVNSEQEVGEVVDFCPVDTNSYVVLTSMLLDYSGEVRFEKRSPY